MRAGQLLNPNATFALAQTLRSTGLTLAEVFTFASGLYFRGKITYARRFAAGGAGEVRIITTNAGLVEPETRVTPESLRAFGGDDINEANPRYLEPLRRDAHELRDTLAADGVAILLGSIAMAKYRDVLLEVFGDRLMFPAEFVGRGDMSRGGLLLQQARTGEELRYVPVRGAIYSGRRAPRIADM